MALLCYPPLYRLYLLYTFRLIALTRQFNLRPNLLFLLDE